MRHQIDKDEFCSNQASTDKLLSTLCRPLLVLQQMLENNLDTRVCLLLRIVPSQRVYRHGRIWTLQLNQAIYTNATPGRRLLDRFPALGKCRSSCLQSRGHSRIHLALAAWRPQITGRIYRNRRWLRLGLHDVLVRRPSSFLLFHSVQHDGMPRSLRLGRRRVEAKVLAHIRGCLCGKRAEKGPRCRYGYLGVQYVVQVAR